MKGGPLKMPMCSLQEGRLPLWRRFLFTLAESKTHREMGKKGGKLCLGPK